MSIAWNKIDNLDLIKYTILLDEEVKNMFIVNRVLMPEKRYDIRLKYRLTIKHDADKICEELNELILNYLDAKP